MPKSRISNMFAIKPLEEDDSIIGSQSQINANNDNDDEFKVDWFYSSIRSITHCMKRLQAEYRCQILTTIVILIFAVCLPNFYPNFGLSTTVFPSLCDRNEEITTKISMLQQNIESNLQKKINSMHDRIEVIQTNIFSKLSSLDKLENIDQNVIEQIKLIQANIQSNIQSNIESFMQQKIQSIQNHIDDHKSSTTQNIQNIENKHKAINDTISAYIGNIQKEISSLKQSITDHASIYDQNHKLIQEIQKEISTLKPVFHDIEANRISDDDKLAALRGQINILKQDQQDLISRVGVLYKKEKKILKADFAVAVIYHTELMTSRWIEYIRMKLYYLITRRYDQTAIQPTFRSGDCTPLRYSNYTNNYIIFKLQERIFLNGLTLEYIEPYLVSNNTQSAPRNMCIELSKDGYHYYLYQKHHYLSYNPYTDGSIKYFHLEETKEKYKYLKLNILSNHGADYTCIYRVQIHGKLS